MIRMRKDSIDDIEFDLMQTIDETREAFTLPGATVTFYAKQSDPAPYQDDPDPPKEITVVCTIPNPASNIAIASLVATDTEKTGKYKCHLKVEQDGKVIYNKYPFEMVIWEE